MLGIIIQARMGSTRLPGKILKQIGDKTLLEHILFRLTYLQHKAQIIIATSQLAQDDAVEDFCRKNGVECFRGSELNVLQRYYQCASKYGFSDIIRLTGDNPLTDITELDNLIELHHKEEADYSHSFNALPVGVGAEIFTYEALKESYQSGKESHHLEHVNEYMLEHPELFKTVHLKVRPEKNYPEIRLTIDTQGDYEKICDIVQNGESEYITTEEAVKRCLQSV